jgi:hypothetical protein
VQAAELEQVLFRGIKAGAVFSAPQHVPDEEDSELDLDDLLDRVGAAPADSKRTCALLPVTCSSTMQLLCAAPSQ